MSKDKLEVYKALFQFQKKAKNIEKSSRNNFGGYDYADLAQVLTDIRPWLVECGLIVHSFQDNEMLITQVIHVESGQYLESKSKLRQDVTLKGMNAFQVDGSAISYLRRYHILSLLNLTAGEDNDASHREESFSSKSNRDFKSSQKSTPKPKQNNVVNMKNQQSKQAKKASDYTKEEVDKVVDQIKNAPSKKYLDDLWANHKLLYESSERVQAEFKFKANKFKEAEIKEAEQAIN